MKGIDTLQLIEVEVAMRLALPNVSQAEVVHVTFGTKYLKNK
jgi:hypothetical protein